MLATFDTPRVTLTHWVCNKIATNLHTTFSNTLFLTNFIVFWLKITEASWNGFRWQFDKSAMVQVMVCTIECRSLRWLFDNFLKKYQPKSFHSQAALTGQEIWIIQWFNLSSDGTAYVCRTDSRLVPSQWEMSFQSSTVSYWLSANLVSALWMRL